MPPLEDLEEVEEIEEVEEAVEEAEEEPSPVRRELVDDKNKQIDKDSYAGGKGLIDGKTGLPIGKPAGRRDIIEGRGLIDGRWLTDGRDLEDFVEGLNYSEIESKYGENAAQGVSKLVAKYKDKIYSVFVSAKEHNLSDADVMIVFNNEKDFLNAKTSRIKSEIRELLKNHSDESTQFWFYYKGQYEGNFEKFECGIPLVPTNADWGPLARIVQLKWQADKGKAIYGVDI
ncbi:MAG: hypothetical protein QXH80_03650, partial [Candidatus Nanoarchaeia archaeon]